MKNYLLIGLSVLTLAPMVLAEPLKLADDSAAFKYTLKTTKDTSLELTDKNVIEKKFEIKVRPSKKIQRLVKSNTFEIILGNSEEEVVFEATPSLHEYDGKEKAFSAVSYYSPTASNGQKVSILCFEKNKATDATEQSEAKKTLACLKTEGCKSYATKENHFELAQTPICIGSKEATVVTKKANIQLNCLLWEGEDNSKASRLIQVLDTKEISEIKSSEKCN